MLEFFKYLLIVLMFGCALWLLIYLFRNKNSIKILFLSGICGVISLVLLNLIGTLIGDTVEINLYTLSTSVILGIPGVILTVLVKIIWMI